MAVVTLCCEIVKIDKNHLPFLRQFIPILSKTLKNLLMSGYAPEYEIGGVKDPFLQVKILELLGKLGHGNSEASDEMSDVLAQIATNTENTKQPGISVLAECVRTIM
jgi:AP-1 complex subunit gamma-1